MCVRFHPHRDLENQSKPCSHSSYSGNIWKLRGEAPRRVEIRLRYRAVFAYSLILAFVRFRDGSGLMHMRATGTLPLPLGVILCRSAGDPEKKANLCAVSHLFEDSEIFFC